LKSLCSTCREQRRTEHGIDFDEWSLVNQAAAMPVESDSTSQDRRELDWMKITKKPKGKA
jgi:hypothetical protein